MSSFSSRPIKVGIVDDSPLIRQLIRSVLEAESGIEVAGEAGDPYEAREMIKATQPDIITLDIEMPRMNGIDFLQKIMTLRPMPVIMLSTLTQKGADITLQALEIGAVDYIAKPDVSAGGASAFRALLQEQLVPKIRAALQMKPGRAPVPALTSGAQASRVSTASPYELIVIAASTGGIERLRYLIGHLPASCPPVLIVQHINKKFVSRMIARMQDIAPPHITVKTGENLEKAKPNTVYFADNSAHLALRPKAQSWVIALEDGPPRNGFIASADHLFFSLADIMMTQKGKHVLALIISGMGTDGADGMLKLRQAGAITAGESADSCLIYGMPKAAADKNALMRQCSLDQISRLIAGEKTN